jgi:tetratricopeptide (TPR) repeat protein
MRIIYFIQIVISYNLGAGCYIALGDYNNAIDDSLMCIKIDPTYSKGYFRGASAYYEKGEFTRAIELLNEYEMIDSDKELIIFRDKIRIKLQMQEILISSNF